MSATKGEHYSSYDAEVDPKWRPNLTKISNSHEGEWSNDFSWYPAQWPNRDPTRPPKTWTQNAYNTIKCYQHFPFAPIRPRHDFKLKTNMTSKHDINMIEQWPQHDTPKYPKIQDMAWYVALLKILQKYYPETWDKVLFVAHDPTVL